MPGHGGHTEQLSHPWGSGGKHIQMTPTVLCPPSKSAVQNQSLPQGWRTSFTLLAGECDWVQKHGHQSINKAVSCHIMSHWLEWSPTADWIWSRLLRLTSESRDLVTAAHLLTLVSLLLSYTYHAPVKQETLFSNKSSFLREFPSHLLPIEILPIHHGPRSNVSFPWSLPDFSNPWSPLHWTLGHRAYSASLYYYFLFTFYASWMQTLDFTQYAFPEVHFVQLVPCS